jgi:hypothetical protein
MKLRCSGCGAEAACECGVAYITAGEFAAKAVKENPTMSARAIAEKFGLGNKTVSRARNETVSNDTVEKTIGLDGRARKKPERKPRSPKITPALEEAIASAVLDDGKTQPQVVAEFGLNSVQPVKIALAKAEVRRDPPIDATALPKSAQEKLQSAIKQAVRKLEGDYEKRVQDGIKQAINDTVLPHYNKKMNEFDEVIKSRKGVLTSEEFRLILSCLHPDQSSSPERLREAFNLFKSHELSLRGEKEMPTSSFVMPRNYADLLKMREEVKAKRKAQKNISRNLPGVH